MSLHSAVSSILKTVEPVMSDGTVVFQFPPVVLSTNAGEVADPVLHTGYVAGATSVTIDDNGGNGLSGDIPDGSTVTIGGTDYTAKDAEQALGGISFTITPALAAPALAGDPVVFSSAPVTVSSSITVSAGTAKDRDFREKVTFAFQYHVDDYAGRPERGTRCVRTTTSGEVLTGNVLDTESGGIMVTVWCGGTVSK